VSYVWTGNRWRDVDVVSWLDELQRQQPDRLRVLKDVYPDYAAMRATTSLWRQDDGGTCPDGGIGRIELQWRGNGIAVRDITIEKAGECGEPLARGR
jgi:hypothetical protein